jgi:hypothetical protein
MAYIDLELLTEKLHKKLVDCSLNKKIKKTLAFIEMCDAIKECPKIDIVQCKECEYWETDKYCEPYCNLSPMMIGTKANDFCSYGKRKENTNEQKRNT